jgi:hypothetical protein
MLDTISLHFNKIFNSSERIEYTDHISKITNANTAADLTTSEVISFYDFKNRRVVVFGTNFGNIAVIEEKAVDKYDYFILYDGNSPLKHLVPFRNLDERDLVYICGDDDERIPDISSRVDLLIEGIQNYYTED